MRNFKLNYLFEILKSSAKPLNIIYPIPILQLLIFSQSKHDLNSFISALIFSFLFYPAVNIWNHVNDVEEDILGGKYNVFAECNVVKIVGIAISIILYLTSLAFLIKNNISLFLYIICFLVTWLYSDKLFFGRIMKRFKDNYITELLSFIIFYPSFTLLIWTFFDYINIKSLAVALTVLFFILFGVFIKDLRDISGDERAGLKTLGVVFNPNDLIRFALTCIILYYISIAIFTSLGIYNIYTIIAILPIILTIYSIIIIGRRDWIISIETITHFKRILLSNMISIALLIITGFLSQP